MGKTEGNQQQPTVSSKRRLRPPPIWFVLFVGSIIFAISLTHWHLTPAKNTIAQPLPMNFRVDINHADVTTLAGLPGLGLATGQRIIDHRDKHGRFEQPDQLTRVNGIGEGKLKQLLPWIICGHGVAEKQPAPATANRTPASALPATADLQLPSAQKSGGPVMEPPLEEASSLPGELAQ